MILSVVLTAGSGIVGLRYKSYVVGARDKDAIQPDSRWY